MWERIRELEVLLASVKESEKKEKGESENSEKERERELSRRARTPTLRRGERLRKNYGERESEGK